MHKRCKKSTYIFMSNKNGPPNTTVLHEISPRILWKLEHKNKEWRLKVIVIVTLVLVVIIVIIVVVVVVVPPMGKISAHWEHDNPRHDNRHPFKCAPFQCWLGNYGPWVGDSMRRRLIIEKEAFWCITSSDQSLINILLENLMCTYFSHGRYYYYYY